MEFRKMVTITLCTRQQKRHWCIEQSFGLCGRGRGWDDLREWHWNMYNIIYETSRQSRLDARYWMLGVGALGWPRGMVRGGMRVQDGEHVVYLWRIHVDIWQNQYNIVKLKNKINFKKRKLSKKKKKNTAAGRDWGQEEKGMTEDEMAGWHHWLGRESEWTPGVGDGQGGLECWDWWGHEESDTTELLNWTEGVGKVGFFWGFCSQFISIWSSLCSYLCPNCPFLIRALVILD